MTRPSFAKLASNPPEPEPEAAPPVIEAAEEEPMLPMHAPKLRQKSRQGRRAITAYLAPEQVKAVRILAAREDRTIEDMAREAFADLLRKYGQHPTA